MTIFFFSFSGFAVKVQGMAGGGGGRGQFRPPSAPHPSLTRIRGEGHDYQALHSVCGSAPDGPGQAPVSS